MSLVPFDGQAVKCAPAREDWGWADWTADIDGDECDEIVVFYADTGRLLVHSGRSGAVIRDYSLADLEVDGMWIPPPARDASLGRRAEGLSLLSIGREEARAFQLDLKRGSVLDISTAPLSAMPALVWVLSGSLGGSAPSDQEWLVTQGFDGGVALHRLGTPVGDLQTTPMLVQYDHKNVLDCVRVSDCSGDGVDDILISFAILEGVSGYDYLASKAMILDSMTGGSIAELTLGERAYWAEGVAFDSSAEGDRVFAYGGSYPDGGQDGEDDSSRDEWVRVFFEARGPKEDWALESSQQLFRPGADSEGVFGESLSVYMFGGRCLLVTTDRGAGMTGRLLCLDAMTGELLWALDGKTNRTRDDYNFGRYVSSSRGRGGAPRLLVHGESPYLGAMGRPAVDVVDGETGEVFFTLDLRETPPAVVEPRL